MDELLVRSESEIGGWRLVEMAVISEKRRRKSYQQDGYRSIVDWVSARADVSHETARRVCWTGSRPSDAPDLAEQMALGEMSFDRAEQVARLPVPTVPAMRDMTLRSCVVWSPITVG